MKKPISRVLLSLIAIGLVTVVLSNSAEAKGRTGSRRSYPGHGKGSHYVGGKVKK